MRKRRFWRLGYILVASLVVLGLMGGGSVLLAQFLWSRTQQATVQVMGSDIGIFADNGCTIPLDVVTVLDFGEVRVGIPTAPVEFWLKNLGTDPLEPVISHSDLGTGLTLTELTYGAVPEDPTTIPLYVPLSWTWTPSGIGNSLSAAVDDTQTTIPLTLGGADIMAAPSWVAIGTEKVYYTGVSGTTLTGCVRGVAGTTAAAHIAGSAANFGTVTESGSLMLAGEVVGVSLTLSADGSAVLGADPFNVLIEATDNI